MDEQQFKNLVDSRKLLTIGDLIALNLPNDYVIKFDSFYGECRLSDLCIDHEAREISVNG